MDPAVVTPGRVARSVEDFADVVARYLMPVIRFVGHKDDHYDLLGRTYPGLVHERKYSGLDADLVIFDHWPKELLQVPDGLSADPAYLFLLESRDELTPTAADLLSHLNAATLVKPEGDVLLWHVKALLLLRDLSYSNGASVFPGFLTVERERRQSMSALVDAVLASRSCVVIVPTDEHRQELLDFLFGTISDVIAPIYVEASSLVPDLLASDRFNIISSNELRDDDVASLFSAIETVAPSRALMVIGTLGAGIESSSLGGALLLSVDRWEEETFDAHLLAYWVATWKSHESGRVEFYSPAVIKQIRADADEDSLVARRLFEEAEPSEATPGDALTSILATYQRLSLDNILSEAERRIMLNLRAQSPLVEAASHAAGIPAVTWHKRARRLADKTSLIELLASARSS